MFVPSPSTNPLVFEKENPFYHTTIYAAEYAVSGHCVPQRLSEYEGLPFQSGGSGYRGHFGAVFEKRAGQTFFLFGKCGGGIVRKCGAYHGIAGGVQSNDRPYNSIFAK